MARKIQHIAFRDAIDVAGVAGKKVAALCGEKIYALLEMDPAIPTCTVCARALMVEHKRLQERPATFVWTSTGNTTWAA